ncbi:pyruvate dehydrogenase complex dihydrolipoamide acetyltransferase [Rubrivirga sp. S365]|uniref:Acetyltransferase component of pyruvate dehydrogenase complex n=1 Tax=Rubrivirga litoralis TaxID=3075598 RepID=A0ABU3BSC2_9BACT|nr:MULTISPECIES: pyruvate dehydrogenase complex dihydrolipoamide acetyltransferase [unclassified Rubrivirga]MDT0632168.1 pyruvate dehydrogenase complex dihydrolipoamide acetyltransferase [Rubrivirga sp. F394]MDT7857062.1 pyruvate dehydrogenase complex dihydrolipoamide acetyltransferase [Rubrivirga sp. S365]
MAIAVEMPKMSDTMEEGVLVSWLADEGASVSAGDVIAQVETDKATMDLEVYDDGVLLKRVVGEGDSVPIGALIAVLGKEGESVDDVVAEYGGDGSAGSAADVEAAPPAQQENEPAPAGLEGKTATADAIDAPAPSAQPLGGDGTTTPPAAQSRQGGADAGAAGTTAEGYGHRPDAAEPQVGASQPTTSAAQGGAAQDGGRVKASPLARRMADEAGLDLAQIAGSGPDGRVVKRDVEAAREGGAAQPAARSAQPVEVPANRPAAQPATPPAAQGGPQAGGPQTGGVETGGADLRITQMRKTIARRLAQSKFTAPHFYLTVDVAMGGAMAFRKDLNAVAAERDMGKVSVNDLITKACAVALRRHPMVNASYLEDEGVIRQHEAAHVAVAVAMPEGLITPVVRNADAKGLAQIAAETRDLAGRARDGKLDPSEYAGSTFTTSNLGMFGISEFTAIINPPNACILAIGTIRDVPVVEGGAVVPGQLMTLTLSCDHRVVDGATGAAFLGDVKDLLEEPRLMLL